MGSGKQKIRNPNRKRVPLGPNRAKKKTKAKSEKNGVKSNSSNEKKSKKHESNNIGEIVATTAAEQLNLFVDQCQSANGMQFSFLEMESVKDKCVLELSQDLAQSAGNLGEHMKAAFGSAWKKVLCEKHLLEGMIDAGNPALLVICLSALRSIELLRGLRTLTGQCHAAKLFSKHMKIEDQVSFLKNRVNIACGTPNRIKKLIEMEALGLNRLAVIVLDMQTDVKGYSLFTLPQVRDEFWDLYKSYFHPRLVQGDLRICLYGQIPTSSEVKKKNVP